MNKEFKRKIYLDVLRIVAIFCVLYNHQPTYSYTFELDHKGIIYVISIVLSIICKVGPPLFLMISGALLLKKDEPISVVWKHRIVRIVLVMLIVSVWNSIRASMFSVKGIFECFTNCNWYLNAYLSYLILLPFLRVMIRNLDEKAVKMFFALAMIIYPLSGVLLVLGVSNPFADFLVFFTADYPSKCWHLIFPILGYYIANAEFFNNKKNRKSILLVLGIQTILSCLIGVVLFEYDMKVNGAGNLEAIRQFCVLAPACAIFYICKILFDSEKVVIPKKLEKVILFCSSATFGIYLLEVSTMISFNIRCFIAPRIVGVVGTYLSYFLPIFVSFIVFNIIVFVLKLIPGIKKLL